MHTGTLDMLHDTRNQDIFAVTYRIHFDFFSLQIFINQNRMILCIGIDDCHEFINFIIVKCNLHSLSTQDIRRTNKYRITDAVCNFLCFLCSKYRAA